MNFFLSGIIMMMFMTIGLYFLKFWTKTRDRFFLIFAVSFWLMALERIVLIGADVADESRHYIYLIRLSAFVLIIAAVVLKNRKGIASVE